MYAGFVRWNVNLRKIGKNYISFSKTKNLQSNRTSDRQFLAGIIFAPVGREVGKVNNIEVGWSVRYRLNRSNCEIRFGHYIDYMLTNPGLDSCPVQVGRHTGVVLPSSQTVKFLFEFYSQQLLFVSGSLQAKGIS